MPITVGRGGKREVTVHGVQGHSGRSKGDHSASKSGPSLCSSPLSATGVQPVVDDPGGDNGGSGGILSCSHLSTLFEAL